ncbi:MAG: FAD-dependent oxidoreductase, partial [Chloroflexota bacterium]|nr:FAD-dependent oxidoreductase [Chloroflexota bacterium]
LHKDSLDPAVADELNRTGVVVLPVPQNLRHEGKLATKACQQYALPEYTANLIILDTGHAKLMTPFFPLDELRQVPGLKNARYEDPYAGGKGNSIRYLALAPRDDYLQVQGVDNMFCGGEKAGLLVGHTEAISTGTLAGHNAVRWALGKPLLALPATLAVGDAITYVREQMQTEAGMAKKYTFSGSVYFERMKAQGTYTTDVAAIQRRVAQAGLKDIFAKPV